MPPSKIRFVTACQQLLALGLVLAVLTPAASVVSLDVVHDRPDATTAATAGLAGRPQRLRPRVRPQPSTVPDRGRGPDGHEYALTAPPAPARGAAAGAPRTKADAARGRARDRRRGHQRPRAGRAGTAPSASPGRTAPRSPRTRSRSRCAPGPATPGRAGWTSSTTTTTAPTRAPRRRGTPAPAPTPLLVGDVDDVQVQVDSTTGDLPPDLKLAVVDPGQRRRRPPSSSPALDTDMHGDPTPTTAPRPPTARAGTLDDRPGRRRRRLRPDRPAGRDVHARSRRSTRAPSGAPTRACATRARCTTTRCTPASSTTR